MWQRLRWTGHIVPVVPNFEKIHLLQECNESLLQQKHMNDSVRNGCTSMFINPWLIISVAGS